MFKSPPDATGLESELTFQRDVVDLVDPVFKRAQRLVTHGLLNFSAVRYLATARRDERSAEDQVLQAVPDTTRTDGCRDCIAPVGRCDDVWHGRMGAQSE